ncbi:MAG: hypothetical protein QM817_33300 [Archangium sp.]
MRDSAAAGISFLALPLSAALFVLGISTTDDADVTHLITEAFLYGGWSMYGVLACGVALTVISAVAAYRFAQGRPLVLVASFSLAIVTMGIAAGGFLVSMDRSMAAIRTAWWSDRPVIVIGSLGEALWPVCLAALIISAVFVTQALGLAITNNNAEDRRAAWLVTLGIALLGGWQFSVARSTLTQIDAFTKVAHAAPVDRVTPLINATSALRNSQVLGVIMLAGVFLTVVAALLTLRDRPRSLAGVVCALLVPLTGLGGFRALANESKEARWVRTSSGLARPLVQLPGLAVTERNPFVSVGERYHNLDDAQEPLLNIVHGDTAQFALEEDFSFRVFTGLLVTLRSMRVPRVALAGATTLETPSGTPDALSAKFVELSGVEAVLGPETCPPPGCATLEASGLTWNGELFPFSTTAGANPDRDPRPIPFALEGQTSASFLKAALAAGSKSRQLLLVFPNP